MAVAKKSNDAVNRLNRTKREAFPDLASEREMYEREARPETCHASGPVPCALACTALGMLACTGMLLAMQLS